jgi:uracil-DNA glycosylase
MSAPCGSVVPFGPRDAKIAIVLDAPCANDIWASRILSGAHGDSFFQMMQQAGMFKSACYFTSLFKYRILGDNFERYATDVKTRAAEHKLHHVVDGLYCNEQMM